MTQGKFAGKDADFCAGLRMRCVAPADSARNESEQTDTLPTVPRKAFFSFFPKSHEISKITSILLTVGKELFKTV